MSTGKAEEGYLLLLLLRLDDDYHYYYHYYCPYYYHHYPLLSPHMGGQGQHPPGVLEDSLTVTVTRQVEPAIHG